MSTTKTIAMKKSIPTVAGKPLADTMGATVTHGAPPWIENVDAPVAPVVETLAAPIAAPAELAGVAMETTDYVEQGNVKAALKGIEKMAGAVMLPRENLKVAAGFNVRAESPDYQQHIESIGRSMHAHGWLKSKPVDVFVDASGAFVVLDGHTRLRAFDWATQTLGMKLEGGIPVVVGETRSMADMTVGLKHQNQGRPLLPIEIAVLCNRLSKWGWDAKKIGASLDMTPRYVGELLGLLAAPAALVSLVEDGTVSASTAMQAIKDNGAAAAAEAIVPLAVAAKKVGKKVTDKTIRVAQEAAGVTPKPSKKQAAAAKKAPAKKVNPADMQHDPMDVLRAVFNDPGFNKLADAVQVMVLAIAA